MTKEVEELEFNYGPTKVYCKEGNCFDRAIRIDYKFVYPCKECPYYHEEIVERFLFGIGGSIGGNVFKQMQDSQIKCIEKKILECRKFNLKKEIKF